MATKYQSELSAVQSLIPDFGYKLILEKATNQLVGQRLDGEVLSTYEVDGVVLRNLSSKAGGSDYTQYSYRRILLSPHDSYPEPQPGDVIIDTVKEKRYTIETKEEVSPDGVALLYDLSVKDG